MLQFAAVFGGQGGELALASTWEGVGRVSYQYVLDFGLGVILRASYVTRGRDVLSYSLVLLLEVEGGVATVRVYDAVHGFNEMHRYGRNQGKQRGVQFHAGTLGEGMRTALAEIKSGYAEMIEGWRAR